MCFFPWYIISKLIYFNCGLYMINAKTKYYSLARVANQLDVLRDSFPNELNFWRQINILTFQMQIESYYLHTELWDFRNLKYCNLLITSIDFILIDILLVECMILVHSLHVIKYSDGCRIGKAHGFNPLFVSSGVMHGCIQGLSIAGKRSVVTAIR